LAQAPIKQVSRNSYLFFPQSGHCCCTTDCVMLLVLRCLLLARLAGAIGNGAQDPRNRKVMRAEKGGPDMMGIDSTGSLFEMGVSSSNSTGQGSSLADTPSDKPCNQRYLPGVEKSTNECTHGTHRPIVTPKMCRDAAAISGALIEDEIESRFTLTFHVDQDAHPANCFAKPCTLADNDGKMCYFYNPEGEPLCGNSNSSATADCDGTPICFATRYGNGTTDANDGCGEGFGVINGDNGEVACRQAASCLGFIPGDQFMIGDDPTHNAAEHLKHPEGCFIEATSGEFRFNRLSALGTPTAPKGTPVCSPLTIHEWP